MTAWDAVCLDCGHEWRQADGTVRFCPECESVDVTAMEVVPPEAERIAVAATQLAASFATIREIAGDEAALQALRDLGGEQS